MSHGRINLEDAARAMLGREREDDKQDPGRSGVRPAPKPKLNFLERSLHDWQEPPAQATKGVR
jgi:hypothetical protein